MNFKHTVLWVFLGASSAMVMTASSGCDINEHSATSGSGGQNSGSSSSSSGDVSSSSGSTSSSSGSMSSSSGGMMPPQGPSGLPIPPGPDNVAKPAGTAGNLKVLAWAGFKSSVSYTFDDGQPSHIEHWPELKATGARMTYYINTVNQNVAPNWANTWKEALAGGNEIANHTAHHCNFNQACNGAPAGSVDAELDDVNKYIVETLGASGVWTMAYPFGDLAYVPAAKARFSFGRGVFSGLIGPSDNTDPFNLPAYAAVGNESVDVFKGAIDSARTQGKWLIFLLHSILPTTQNWYAGVDIQAITGSISHAFGLQDVWVDNLVNVGAYWLGQKTLESTTPQMMGAETKWIWTLPAHFPPGKYVRVKVDGGTLKQAGTPLAWDGHGFYEVALDAGELTLSP